MYKKISYQKFVEEVKNNILKFMPEDFADASVEIAKVTKVNETLNGLRITKGKNNSIVPTLYLENFYDENNDLDNIMMNIANVYVEVLSNILEENNDNDLLERAMNTSNIVFTIVNQEKMLNY